MIDIVKILKSADAWFKGQYANPSQSQPCSAPFEAANLLELQERQIEKLTAERDAATESARLQADINFNAAINSGKIEKALAMATSERDQALQQLNEALGKSVQLISERDALAAELHRVKTEAVKSERRAIQFGDIVQTQILAMQADVIDAHLDNPKEGMQWIINTLSGPGLLPDVDAAKAIGGAQAFFDKAMAEHDEFRAAHPAPELPAKEGGAA